jgi:hypothetical protein
MAKGYLTDQEIDEITAAIYNDNNEALFKSLPEGPEDFNDGGIVKELAEGQEYYIIPQSNIILRKDGRVFNVKFIRVLKPLWTPYDILAIVNGKQIRYSEIYKSQGWKFDQKEITQKYVNNKWEISVPKGYRQMYKELYG